MDRLNNKNHLDLNVAKAHVISTTKPLGSLTKNSMISAFFTLTSRITGFMRDIVSANLFGATSGYDAFIIAFRIPNLLRRLLAEGAFSQAFVPVFAEYSEQKPLSAIKLFVDKIAGNLLLILIIVTGLGIACAPYLIKLFAPGFVVTATTLPKDIALLSQKFNFAVTMLRLVFPYILFISLTAFSAGILNCYNCFAVPALTPVLLNLSLILCSLTLSPNMGVPEFSLAIATVIAGVLQLGLQVPFLAKLNLLPRFKIDWRDQGVRRVLWLLVPAILGAAISQINIMVDSIFASFLETGSVSWLYYADRLMEFPLGVFGVSVATVILPKLSKNFSKGNYHAFNQILNWGVKCSLLLGVPSSLGLLLLSKPLVFSLFFLGKFTVYDVVQCSQAVTSYAFSVVGIMLAKIIASGFYASGDLKTPVKIGTIILIVNIGLNFLCIKVFNLAHSGIALATTIASITHATLLYISLTKKMFKLIDFKDFLIKLSLASLALSGFLYYYPGVKVNWADLTLVVRIIKLSEILGLSLLVYIGTLKFVRFEWNKIVIGEVNE